MIDAIAKDITETLEANNPPKWFLALPETIYERVVKKVSPALMEKLFVGLRKDLTKENKSNLVELFKKKLS